MRIDFGVIRTNLNNESVGYIEKPTNELLVSMGVYVFEPRALPYIGYNEYLDLPDLVLKLIASGEPVQTYPYEGYWMDLGRVDDYEHAAKDFETMKEQFLGDEVCEEDVAVEIVSQF